MKNKSLSYDLPIILILWTVFGLPIIYYGILIYFNGYNYIVPGRNGGYEVKNGILFGVILLIIPVMATILMYVNRLKRKTKSK